jgi:predicted metal-dependent RNase
MQVVFVGGASSVGASCLAIQLAEQWIVVDTGVRVDRKSDPLPDLSLLEGKDVQAIFVTHAHADHDEPSRAYRRRGESWIYCTRRLNRCFRRYQ